jgi:hypothetical protein
VHRAHEATNTGYARHSACGQTQPGHDHELPHEHSPVALLTIILQPAAPRSSARESGANHIRNWPRWPASPYRALVTPYHRGLRSRRCPLVRARTAAQPLTHLRRQTTDVRSPRISDLAEDFASQGIGARVHLVNHRVDNRQVGAAGLPAA